MYTPLHVAGTKHNDILIMMKSTVHCPWMHEMDVWQNSLDVDFDNAMEVMEELMNRVYDLYLVYLSPLDILVVST